MTRHQPGSPDAGSRSTLLEEALKATPRCLKVSINRHDDGDRPGTAIVTLGSELLWAAALFHCRPFGWNRTIFRQRKAR